MNDEELLGYAKIHSRTDCALFSEAHANRLLALAGMEQRVSGWVSIDRWNMDALLVRVREQKDDT